MVGQELIGAEMPLKVNHTAVKLKMRGQTMHNCIQPTVELNADSAQSSALHQQQTTQLI